MGLETEWDKASPLQSDWDKAAAPTPAVTPAPSKQNPGTAGILNFGTSLAGLPVDTVTNALNMGIAGVGRATGTTPGLIERPFGGSESLRRGLRSTGIPELSPDNPDASNKTGTAAYDLASRGGFIPGGVLAAGGSMLAEKIGGPQWAGVGAMAPAAAGQAVRAISPTMTPQTELLTKAGVELTPGQKYGGGLKRAEDAATSIPVLGDAIKGAQRRGIETFDAAAINRSLAPIGEKLPKGLVGNKAVDYAYTKLGDAYDELLPKLGGNLDYPLKADLKAIKIAGQELPEPQRGQLNRILEREVERRFNPQHGTASGNDLKDIESKLGSMAKRFAVSDDYDVRTMGEAVKEAQVAVRKMVERVNPQYQGELSKINDGYANFKIAQKAATSVAAPDGAFTAAQLHSAVKAKDSSKDKARFSEGAARMQDLSSAGKAVLPSSVPDSGTPYRAALMYAMAHPVKAGIAAPFLGAAALPYTSMGQGVLSGIASGQPTSPSLQALIQSILANQQQRQ